MPTRPAYFTVTHPLHDEAAEKDGAPGFEADPLYFRLWSFCEAICAASESLSWSLISA